MEHPITWFEIPVADMDRAIKFYNAVLAGECSEPSNDGTRTTALLPYGMVGGGGSLTMTDGFTPGSNGVVIYLNGGEDLQVMLDRVKAEGGTVTYPKTDMGSDMGYLATFTDSEGNTLGLFSQG
ncbi:MAG: VOC family protein [Chloroflexota bacterium]